MLIGWIQQKDDQRLYCVDMRDPKNLEKWLNEGGIAKVNYIFDEKENYEKIIFGGKVKKCVALHFTRITNIS